MYVLEMQLEPARHDEIDGMLWTETLQWKGCQGISHISHVLASLNGMVITNVIN